MADISGTIQRYQDSVRQTLAKPDTSVLLSGQVIGRMEYNYAGHFNAIDLHVTTAWSLYITSMIPHDTRIVFDTRYLRCKSRLYKLKLPIIFGKT